MLKMLIEGYQHSHFNPEFAVDGYCKFWVYHNEDVIYIIVGTKVKNKSKKAYKKY
ncbi:MAG: hypothetical protein KAR43_14180 [Deltaproteobacteria bacterium]|nr:hypothetical protein [Deltaproteobacteria bacterium]